MNADQLRLTLADQRTVLAPGETIEGTAEWTLAAAPQSVEARLFWYTRGKGTEDVEIVSRQTLTSSHGAGRASFHFALPEGPYSFSGKLVSLRWAIELVVTPGGANTRWDFTVSPHGREILLHT